MWTLSWPGRSWLLRRGRGPCCRVRLGYLVCAFLVFFMGIACEGQTSPAAWAPRGLQARWMVGCLPTRGVAALLSSVALSFFFCCMSSVWQGRGWVGVAEGAGGRRGGGYGRPLRLAGQRPPTRPAAMTFSSRGTVGGGSLPARGGAGAPAGARRPLRKAATRRAQQTAAGRRHARRRKTKTQKNIPQAKAGPVGSRRGAPAKKRRAEPDDCPGGGAMAGAR